MNSQLTLSRVFYHSTSQYVSNIAFGFVDEKPFTYNDILQEVQHLIHFLHTQGIQKGDKVAILGENSPQWAITYFSVTVMGAIAIPVLPEFHTNEVHHIIRHSEAKALFVSERYFQKIQDLDLYSFQSVVLLDNLSQIEVPLSKASLKQLLIQGGKELKKIRSLFKELTKKFIPEEVHEDDIAAIVYTSGTTGHTKGVMLTHKNIVWNAQQAAEIPHINQNDRLLSILPLAHVYECTLGLVLPFMKGASVYYIKKPPSPAVLISALEKIKPTAMLSVPLVIEKIFKTKVLPKIKKHVITKIAYHFPSLRKILHRIAGKKLYQTFGGSLRFFGIGGASLSPEVEQFLIEAHFPYAIGYGLTETSPLIAGSNAYETKFRSTGPPLPGIELKIENANPYTKIGEIVVRGPNIMKGYYRDKVLTSEVLSDDGWLRTGDLGYIDEDGFLYIKGRLKNVLLGPNGENIYPEAIESVLNKSEYVLESLVYKEGSQLVARVYLDYERIETEFNIQHLDTFQVRKKISELLESIKNETNNQISTFSRIQKIIEQQEPFEKTPTQKIKRYLYTPSENFSFTIIQSK